ncbi:hypothetical protein C8T65DRAFT_573063, partial [Cerioporus squamosus]
DLSTRRGLRKALSEIDRVHAALDEFLQDAKRRNSSQLLAAVVNILIKMCADSMIKEKLFERGLIRTIVDLLEYDTTRCMGLRLLLVFTQDGCRTHGDVLEQIAHHGGVLCQIVQDHADDRLVMELATVVLAHVARFVISSAPEAPDRQVNHMGLRDVLPTMLHVVRKPQPSKSLLTHALMSLTTPAQYISAQFKDNHALATLFIALLRANQLTTRAAALEGILNCQIDSESNKFDIDLHHLAQTLKHARPMPSIVGLTVEDYPQWLEQSDSADLYRQSVKYVGAMSQAARDQDLLTLGRAIADIVQRSPSIVEGSWQELEQLGSRRVSSRLPFSLWSDALPECARLLRINDTPSDRDAADILDMKFYMLRNRKTEAVALARKTIARNPNLTYAHYVVSLCGETSEALRAAMEGLLCPDVTKFLRKQLLWRAVESAVWQGFQQILTADIEDEHSQEEGAVTLRTALHHAQSFLAESPPDAHLRLTMLGWSFILTLALRGPELSPNLRELDHFQHEADTTYAVMDFFGYPVRKTRLYNAWNNIRHRYDESLREWAEVVEACNALDARIVCTPELCSGAGAEYTRYTSGNDEGPLPEVYLGMQQCLRCGGLSATMKKCKGCGAPRTPHKRVHHRYCDTKCQKHHWETHKGTCGGRGR